MKPKELTRRLQSEAVVSLTAEEWAALSPGFEEIERHDTTIAGDLIIIRTPSGPAAVESPSADSRVVRRLADEDAVREFVTERLELYERMWDGCGCRIDYTS